MTEVARRPGSRRRLRTLFALLGLSLALALWTWVPPEVFSAESLARHLNGSGPWGVLLFILVFALVEPFGVPGVVFVIPAAIVWPVEQAFLYSWLGANAAGLVGFAFARTIGRDWVQQHMPARFRRFDERLETRGVVTVIVLRLVFFLSPPAHWVLGLSRVSLGAYLLGSAIGFVPGILTWLLLGEGAWAWLASRPAWTWAVAAGALALFLWWRRPADAD